MLLSVLEDYYHLLAGSYFVSYVEVQSPYVSHLLSLPEKTISSEQLSHLIVTRENLLFQDKWQKYVRILE